MKAIALICSKSMVFSLESVQLPEPAPGEVVVRTAFSGISIGTELALIQNKISWGPYPLCTGYMATGVVEALGADVSGVAVGDKVFVRGNRGIALEDGTAVSPTSGTHCSHLVTRMDGTHGAGILPENVSMETASLFVMPAVGFNGVDMAQPKAGESVVVFGCGQIGLGVVSAAALRGCRVIAVDVEPHALDMARVMGADDVVDSSREDPVAAIERLCPGGADVVFECTGIPTLVDRAIALCRIDGKFVWQGNYGAAPIQMSFLAAHGRRLRTYYPCDDGYMPCRLAVLKQMARGVLPWEKTITHRVQAAEAPALFERINGGDRSVAGAAINWSCVLS